MHFPLWLASYDSICLRFQACLCISIRFLFCLAMCECSAYTSPFTKVYLIFISDSSWFLNLSCLIQKSKEVRVYLLFSSRFLHSSVSRSRTSCKTKSPASVKTEIGQIKKVPQIKNPFRFNIRRNSFRFRFGTYRALRTHIYILLTGFIWRAVSASTYDRVLCIRTYSIKLVKVTLCGRIASKKLSLTPIGMKESILFNCFSKLYGFVLWWWN